MERTKLNASLDTRQYVTDLENISRYISIYICLFYIIIGNLGNIFKVLFFLQKPLRLCPCSVYVLAATMSDFVTLNNIPILRLLQSLHSSNQWIQITMSVSNISDIPNEGVHPLSQQAITVCKVRNYLHMWSTDVSIYLLLFASINRYFVSSKKLNRRINRRFSNVFCSYSNAIKVSFGAGVIWALVSLHHYFNFTIISHFCLPKHFLLWAIWISNVHCLLPSILMIIFSTLTLINIRRNSSLFSRSYGNNVQKTTDEAQKCVETPYSLFDRHHIEQQLTSMMITETIGTIVTTLPYAIYTVYKAVKTNHARSSATAAREDLIEQMIQLTMYLEPSCGFYVYLFTLKTLRKRFFSLAFKNCGSFDLLH